MVAPCFCVRCGVQVSSSVITSSNLGTNAVSSESQISTAIRPPTLNAFMNKKMEERRSHFKTNKKGKQAKSEDEEVTINIGLMKTNEDGQLKPVRGKNLPLKIRKSANSQDILNSGFVKHSLRNSTDINKSSPESYKLLYPDGTQ